MSASVAVWVREPEVPVKVIVGAADAAVVAAVTVVEAEVCGGASVSVDGLAVTPAGSPEIVTETVPAKEFIEVAVTVMALLVVPALRVREAGETASEKSGVGCGDALPPQVVRTKSAVSAAMDPSALASLRMWGDASASLTVQQWQSILCHRDVIVGFPRGGMNSLV